MKSRIHVQVLLLVFGFVCSTAEGQQTTDQIISRKRTAAVERPPARRSEFPELRQQTAPDQNNVDGEAQTTTPVVSGSMVTVCSALAIVLGLFAGLVWVNRKLGAGSGNHGAIPSEVIQPLGSTALDSRNRITMLRCGNRILVLAQNAQGVQPIAEITSPAEVQQLTAACLGDSKQAFSATLQSIEQEQTEAGFLDGQAKPPPPGSRAPRSPRSRGRLFTSA